MSEIKQGAPSELRAGDKVRCILSRGYVLVGQRGEVLSIDGTTQRAFIRWQYASASSCRNHDLADLGVTFVIEGR